MVNELTELSTYAGLKVSTKDIKVKTNSAEMKIKLNEETFEHVPEHNVGWTVDIKQGQHGNTIKKRNGMVWKKFKSLGQTIPKIIERDVMEFGVFPVLLRDAQTSSLKEKEKCTNIDSRRWRGENRKLQRATE
jgi:hypothetical protein